MYHKTADNASMYLKFSTLFTAPFFIIFLGDLLFPFLSSTSDHKNISLKTNDNIKEIKLPFQFNHLSILACSIDKKRYLKTNQ